MEKHPPADTLSSLQSLLVTVVIAVFVITFIVQAFQIPSESMENTLLIGDYLLVDKLRYGGTAFWDLFMPYRQVHRGDIIVFRYPVHPTQHFVKRVVGRSRGSRTADQPAGVCQRQSSAGTLRALQSPRRTIRFATNSRGSNLPVPGLEGGWWLEMKKLVEDGELIVPQGNYFVLGDNRDESLDSRYWGFVPQENVIGRPLLIYWSVRNTDQDMPASPTPGDKLYHFAYAVDPFVSNDALGPHISSSPIVQKAKSVARKTQWQERETQARRKAARNYGRVSGFAGRGAGDRPVHHHVRPAGL